MIELTRRQFLQSLMAIGAGIAIPAEFSLLDIPDTPITAENPAATLWFEDQISIAGVRSLVFEPRYKEYISVLGPIMSTIKGWDLTIETFEELPATSMGKRLEFEIRPEFTDFKICGNGYLAPFARVYSRYAGPAYVEYKFLNCPELTLWKPA